MPYEHKGNSVEHNSSNVNKIADKVWNSSKSRGFFGDGHNQQQNTQ